jgi:PTH1 family peptidyl-tRNA hydrolase
MHPGTRHNAGMMAINELLKQFSLHDKTVDWKNERRIGGWIAACNLDQSLLQKCQVSTKLKQDTAVFLFKPKEFMNLSGLSVKKAVDEYGITARDELIIFHDDLDLKFGTSKVKTGGSGRGHNGIRSVVSSLGTSDFTRCRIGIGRPSSDSAIDRYVLDKFPADQRDELERKVFPKVVTDVLSLVVDRVNSRIYY